MGTYLRFEAAFLEVLAKFAALMNKNDDSPENTRMKTETFTVLMPVSHHSTS